MKILKALFVSALVCLPFVSEGEAYRPAKVTVVWDTPTTNLPTALWVYKVIPQNFSPAVVSNLMALGSFTSKNLTKMPVDVPDKNLIQFRFSKGTTTRYLNIAPALGWMEYYDGEATPKVGNEEAVPDDKEAARLARDFLFQVGIDRALVAEKPTNMSVGRQGKAATATQKETEAVFSRGVFLPRRLDGVNVYGNGTRGGLLIDFGNHGRIMNFNLIWRNLIPWQAYRTATASGIVEYIKQGKSSLAAPLQQDLTGATTVKVRKATVFYEGADETTRQEFVRPFVELEMETELQGQTVKFPLHCPILMDEPASKQRE